MLPSRFGGSRPPLSTQRLPVLWLAVLAGVSLCLPAAALAGTSARFRVDTSLSQVQRMGASPTASFSLLSVDTEAPLSQALSLSAELRMDTPSLNAPGRGFSVNFDPGHADYGLALKMTPSYLPVGLEYNRLAGNAAAIIDPQVYAASDNGYLLDDSASQLFSLRQQGLHHRLRVGWGSMGVESNVAPMLLGLHGFLPVHGRATGPFTTLSAERLRLLGFVGRAGVMLMLDTRAHGVDRGDYLAWGVTMHRVLREGLILGTSYMAGNSSLPGTSAPSTLSFYLRLRWHGTKSHAFGDRED